MSCFFNESFTAGVTTFTNSCFDTCLIFETTKLGLGMAAKETTQRVTKNAENAKVTVCSVECADIGFTTFMNTELLLPKLKPYVIRGYRKLFDRT